MFWASEPTKQTVNQLLTHKDGKKENAEMKLIWNIGLYKGFKNLK